MRWKHNPARLAQVEKLILSGHTCEEAEVRMHAPKGMVSRAVREYLPHLKPTVHAERRRRVIASRTCWQDKKKLATIKKLIRAGMTTPDIGLQMRAGPGVMHYVIKTYLPDLVSLVIASGKKKQLAVSTKETPAENELMHKLSTGGYGIDWIGNKLGRHGTTIRYRLMRDLGKAGYKKRHPRSRYKGGPKGGHRNARGDFLQSHIEEVVADRLHDLAVPYNMHTVVTHAGCLFYPDFYLPRVGKYIEVAGMMNMEFYRKRVVVKKRAYKALRLQVHWIENPKDTKQMKKLEAWICK